MIQYVLRRLATSVIVILGVSVITFVLLHGMAGSPGRAILGVQASPGAVAAFEHEHGYDHSIVVQYLSYLHDLLRGSHGFQDPEMRKALANIGNRIAQMRGEWERPPHKPVLQQSMDAGSVELF